MTYEPDFVSLTHKLREFIIHAQPPKITTATADAGALQ